MSKKEEVRNEISNIYKILITAKECFQYSQYLSKPDTPEEQDYLNHSQDLGFIRHMLWRMTVIELSKLFSNSKGRDKFNIFHFISKLKKGGHFGDIGIDETTITNWENKIEDSKTIITQVLTLRDKVYAHTDSDKEKYTKSDLTYQQTEKLIQIVENLVKEIYATVFDAQAIMDTPIFNKKRFNIIKVLASEKNSRIKNLQATLTKLT